MWAMRSMKMLSSKNGLCSVVTTPDDLVSALKGLVSVSSREELSDIQKNLGMCPDWPELLEDSLSFSQ